MKKNKSTELEVNRCNCEYCTATYYSLKLFSKALMDSKNEDDRVHNIYEPLARIVIPRSKWRSEKLVDLFYDARAQAVGNMFVFSKKYGLTDSEISLRGLLRVARAGCSYVLRQYNKHDRTACIKPNPEEEGTSSTNVEQKRIIGRRVYPTESNDFKEDAFTRLIDKIKADRFFEENLVSRMDAIEACRRILSSSDPRVYKQAIANLASIFCSDEFENESIPTRVLIGKIRLDVDPLALNEMGIQPDMIDTFFYNAEQALGPIVSLKLLKAKAYNRKKTQVLDRAKYNTNDTNDNTKEL